MDRLTGCVRTCVSVWDVGVLWLNSNTDRVGYSCEVYSYFVLDASPDSPTETETISKDGTLDLENYAVVICRCYAFTVLNSICFLSPAVDVATLRSAITAGVDLLSAVVTCRIANYLASSILHVFPFFCAIVSGRLLHAVMYPIHRTTRVIYTPWVKKECHPNHGYNFVNSWSICKILSLLHRTVNLQQNSY